MVSKDLDKRLGDYVGKNVNVMIVDYGIPQEEKVIASKKLYLWNNKNTYQGSGGYWQGDCVLRAQVDSSETIEYVDYKGDYGSCSTFAYGKPGTSK